MVLRLTTRGKRDNSGYKKLSDLDMGHWIYITTQCYFFYSEYAFSTIFFFYHAKIVIKRGYWVFVLNCCRLRRQERLLVNLPRRHS